MPQIKFTDTNLKTLSADSTTWFSDPTCKGLQLCVTAGGVKTWYVNKWDSTAQKTRRVKLGQWSAQGKHTAWAKKQVGKTAHDIDEGAVKTRQEREAEAASKAVPPTLREAFELEAASRLGLDDAFGGPRAEETVQNYRSVFERKLDGLLDTRVDEIDHGEIQRRLDALTKSAPFAAHKLHIALSYARTQALSALNIEHMPFRWPSMKKMPIMRDRKDKDRESEGPARMTVAANVRDFLAGLTVSLDPVERFRAAIGVPDPFQVEILRSDPANDPQDAMLCCVASRQIGKSTAIAALAWDDATRGKTVLIACPSLRQSTELLRRVVEFKNADPFAPKVVRQVQTEIETMNGGRIISIPATDNARGMTCDTLILDEAAFHEDEAITALLPMRRSTGRTLMISTPNGRQGFFWEVFSEKKARIIFARSVDSKRPDVLSKVEYDRRFMADFRFRQEHLCEFLSGNGTQLISWDTLSRATDNTEKALVL